MSRLLLVEDDESLSAGIAFTLKCEGYDVQIASTVQDAKNTFQSHPCDLIILDVNLPDGNGYDFCKFIRESSDVPILFLTALDQEVNVVLGLEIGGDDYITKPFRVRELLARVKVLLRRNSKGLSSGNSFISGNILVDTATAKVKVMGKDVPLTVQEYKLLLIFMNNPCILIKRNDLLSELTEGAEVFFDENTLSVYIKRIREKIEENPKQPEYIITQRGLGYQWNKEVSVKGMTTL